MKKSLLITSLLLTFILTNISAQTDQVFIYGKIHTVDGDTYQGAIRWGKEEIYWSDMFNSSKTRNPYLRYLSREDSEKLDQHNDNSISTIFGDIELNGTWSSSHEHTFACNFGDIKTLYVKNGDRVEVILKNGEEIDLEGGSNDIGANIVILDEDMGKIVLRWSRIDKIEFMKTPRELHARFGEPLYGTVITDHGAFTGLIQWDHDERISTDKLDGDHKDGEISIAFGKIKSIESAGRGSEIVLKSGKEIYLTGSNDVNYDNRGIIVNIPKVGRVDIKWDDFRKVTFDDLPEKLIENYESFAIAKEIKGTIVLRNGDRISGRLAYDLDETFDIEMLNGNDNDIQYSIPFRNIKRIAPRNFEYSNIELKNGLKILLGEEQDVSDKNDGILVFGSGEPKYFSWKEIEEIIIE